MEVGRLIGQSIRLSKPLGAGGMGSVWLADHLTLETTVVVKFMHGALGEDPANRERFTREAVAASQVKSPHVVQTFDHGLTPEGIPYIVMERLEGEDLGKRLERGCLSTKELGPILVQVCRALSRAHAVGVVHRDIKPDNIFLCDVGGGEPFVKLLDFGIAKTAPNPKVDEKTRTGALMGTPYYMSPEQFLGLKGIDSRTDLWSLGIVGYECLTGMRPFEAETVGGLAVAIHTQDVPMPSAPRPELRPLDAWFAKACCRQAAGRFQNAKEFADAFTAACNESDASGVAFRPPALSAPMLDADAIPATVPAPPRATGFAQAGTPRLLMSTGASAAVEAVSIGKAPYRRPWTLIAAAGALGVVAIIAGAITLGSHGSPDSTVAAASPSATKVDTPPVDTPTQQQVAPAKLAELPAELPSLEPAPSSAATPPAVTPAAKPVVGHVAIVTPGPVRAPPAAVVAAPVHVAPAHAAGPAAVNCSPPFTIDGAGVKHPKPECL